MTLHTLGLGIVGKTVDSVLLGRKRQTRDCSNRIVGYLRGGLPYVAGLANRIQWGQSYKSTEKACKQWDQNIPLIPIYPSWNRQAVSKLVGNKDQEESRNKRWIGLERGFLYMGNGGVYYTITLASTLCGSGVWPACCYTIYSLFEPLVH